MIKLPFDNIALVMSAALMCAAGCAHQPSAETVAQVARTQTSIQQAEQAGAGQAALQDLQAAKDKLRAAQEALNKKSEKDDVRALHLAQQAELDAQYASAKAQSSRQREAVEELQRSIESLRQEVSRRGTG